MIFEIENYASLHESMELLCGYLLEQGVSAESVFDSKLVAYELLGNVLKHADGKARLQCRLLEEFVELKIYTKEVFALPENKPCPEAMSENGRGLFLVDAVCEGRFFAEEDGLCVQIRMK